MPEKLAAVPEQSFPETWKPKIGASVIVNTGGVAQQWRVSHIKIATGTLVTIKFENSETIVDKSWYVFDTSLGSLVLQRLGFFGDMALKRTTSSFEVWRNILNPEKMMDGEAFFWFLVCYTATQLATQLQQRCILVVCGNKEAWKRLTESNGTPAIDLVHMSVVLK